MGKRAGKVEQAFLVDVPLPEATKTYTVISHEFLINTTRLELQKKGFEIKKEVYKSIASGEIATAQYRIEYGNDPDLGMLFSWANSYDKSMKFRCSVGGFVRQSGASVISDTINNFKRMHTGTALEDTEKTIIEQIGAAEAYFSQLCRDKDLMKSKTLTTREFSEIVGILYMEMNLISVEQASVIKKELKKPRFTYTTPEDSLWTLYNHILVSLAKSNPKHWMNQQSMVHMFIMDHVGLKSFNPEQHEKNIELATEQLDKKDFIATGEEEEVTEGLVEASMAAAAEEKVSPEAHEEKVEEVDLDKEEDEEWDKQGMVEIKATNEFKPVDPIEEEKPVEFEGHTAEGEEPLEEEEKFVPTATVGAAEPIMMAKTDIETMQPGATAGDLIPLTTADGDFIFEIMSIEGDDENWALLQQEVSEEQLKAEGEGEASAAVDTVLPKQATEEEVAKEEPVAESETVEVETQENMDVEAVEKQSIDGSKIIAPEDIEIIAPEAEVPDDSDPIRQKIQAEILDIYGTIREFTYIKKGNQYNVTLDTGEVFVLMETELEAEA